MFTHLFTRQKSIIPNYVRDEVLSSLNYRIVSNWTSSSLGLMGGDDQFESDGNPQPPVADSDATDKSLVSGSRSSSGSVGFQLENPNFDGTDRGHCTEGQLREMMLTKLDWVYNEAIHKLVALGYDEGVAEKGILTSGHCYGNMDALTNILHSTLGYLNSLQGKSNDGKQMFDNLTQWRQFSLVFLVSSLRRLKPSLSKGDAMWCLLMSDLDIVRAAAANDNIKVEKVNSDSIGVTAASCSFQGGWSLGNSGTSDSPVIRPLSHADSEETSQRDIGSRKWPELSPTKNMLLKSNVALFAAEYRANLKSEQGGDSSSAVDTEGKAPDYTDGSLEIQDHEGAEMMLKEFRDLNLEGDSEFVPEDEKDEALLSLVHGIKDLERQVKERKEWAHQKAIQAARKLSHDLNELKMLRMEREESQRLKQRKQNAEDSTMKRLSEMQSALSGQVGCANLAVRRLEVENAEIRAEMEASKLSASESVTICLEVARREKKSLKKLLAWEKQRAKLQDDITAEKQRIMELQEELLQVEAAKKTSQTKLMQDQKAKELAFTQVEEERRLKEATEADNQRKHGTLRSKIELDFQRYKDDLQRLEQELSRIKTSNDPDQQWINPQTGTIASLLYELDEDDCADEIDRACVFCLKDEVSVLLLPCAHQVLCAGCNDEYVKGGCPTCRVPIEQRIRVFG